MKIKNREIMNFANYAFGHKQLPMKLAYAITVNADAISGAVKAFEDSRMKLAEKFAVKDEDGNPVIVDGRYDIEDLIGFNAAFAELHDMEAEVNVTTVSMDDIAKCDDPGFDKLTVAELAILKFMVE